MDALNSGTVLHGKSYEYKIIKTLGQGTFGITYLASVKMTGGLGSLDSEILVAVKEFFMRDFNGRNDSSVTYSSKDGAFGYYKSKFIHEAESLSKLSDTGIVKVIELFEENQTAYYVMEYLKQGSLDSHIKSKGFLTGDEWKDYSRQIAKALGYMHRNKMLHLDLKPNNIMLRDNDEVVLIDFGLSKRFDAYGKPETSTTIGHGTPGYAPIEQANYQGHGNGEFPATMDIYALGATMFKMLTGHRPPEASYILNEGFPEDELIDLGVPEAIISIVRKCMEPLRKNRYKSTDEVIAALDALDEGTVVIGHGGRVIDDDPTPTWSPVPFRKETDKMVISYYSSKVGKGYEITLTPLQMKVRATAGYLSSPDLDGKAVLIDSNVFVKIAKEIESWGYFPNGAQYKMPEHTAEVPDKISVLLYDRMEDSPYLALESVTKTDRQYGNLQEDAFSLSKKITSLIPKFDELIARSMENKTGEDGGKGKEKKRDSWGDVIGQNIIITIVVCVLALPTFFFVKPTDRWYYCLWITLAVMELTGGILFGLGGRYSKKLESFSFFIALLCVIAYIAFWIAQMCYWWA